MTLQAAEAAPLRRSLEAGRSISNYCWPTMKIRPALAFSGCLSAGRPHLRARETLRSVLAQISANAFSASAGERHRHKGCIFQSTTIPMIVDTTAAFADGHPSGILLEELTLASLIENTHGQTYPALPRSNFLVDGKERGNPGRPRRSYVLLPDCCSARIAKEFEISMAPVIGVFDSGFGGLTVLLGTAAGAAAADYLYFGDTAHLPYGAKSVRTVAKYAISACAFS